MKQYFQVLVLWIANSLRELRLESLGILVFLPYMGFWFMMFEAQHFMGEGAKYASAHHGVELDGAVWGVLFCRIFSLAAATMVVNSQLCIIWYSRGNEKKLSKPLIQSLALLVIYAPMAAILIRSDF